MFIKLIILIVILILHLYDLITCLPFIKLTTPCSSFTNPNLGNLDVILMFNVVNYNEGNTFSHSLYVYIIMVQDYPVYINVINELGQK